MRYNAKNGDSPSKIARKYGVNFDRLIAANPRKATTVVTGPDGIARRTWRSLSPRETIIVPVGGVVGEYFGPAGYLGDVWADAIKPLVDAGGPCLQQNVGLVCAAQRALGVSPDGKWGSDSATAAKGISGAPPACSPRPSWWAPKGQSNCTTAAAPRPAATTAPSSGVSSLLLAANAARAALAADPGYCTSVKKSGTPVNTAIHNFKTAWNSANPNNKVPINTGNYEQSVADALSSVIGQTAPPGCGAGAAAPTPSASVSPASAPAAVQMLLGINPCDPANAAAVCAAQRALGVSPDGKYGADTATAARRLAPQAPAGCSPRPSWWAPKGQTNCGGAAPAPTPAPTTRTTAPTGGAPAAVQALVGIDPCLQANSGIVYAAQSALGILADGKYGAGTSAAARALGVNAPAGCSPPPLWWGAKGTAKAATATQTAKTAAASTPSGGGGTPAATTDQAKAAAAAAAAQAADAAAKAQAASTPAQADQAATDAKAAQDAAARAAAQATTQAQADQAAAAAKVAADAAAAAAAKGGTPSGGGGTVVVTPPEEKKGLSTGAIVAGAIGAAALVGIVALAVGGKGGHAGHAGKRGKRGSSGHRKHSGGHKKKSSHRKKR